jgi:predicted TIM-barrel fold metal-dependent hydrolase
VIVDADAHVNESLDALEQFIEEPYRSRRPRTLTDTTGRSRILLEGRLYPEPRLRQAHSRGVEGVHLGGSRPGAYDPSARLADLDVEGIDVQVIYGSLGLAVTSIADADFAVAMSRALNDYYADFCGEAPARLRCVATLPLQDVAASVEEMRRAVRELGHVGVVIPPNVDGRNLDDPAFAPVFAEAERLDAPVSVHWGNGAYLRAAGTERFDTHFMVHAVGHPFEQMIAFASVVCGGVLEAFPQLRVGFLEAGCGWLPFWAERLHEHWERRGAEMPRLRADPLEYLARGSCFFTTEPDEQGLPAALGTAGVGNLMYASDYPHSDSKFPDSVRCLRERRDVSEDVKGKLLGENAARYYRLGGGPVG